MANLSAEEADLCPDKAAVEPMEVNSSDQGVEQVDPAQTQDQCPASTSSGNTHIHIACFNGPYCKCLILCKY